MDTYELLEQAIRDKQPVAARYDGGVREFCPHALGTKRGRRHVLAYQYGGASASGLPAGGEWRCLDVERLSEVAVRAGEEWRSAPNVFNPQSCLDEVEAVVEPFPPLRRAEEDLDQGESGQGWSAGVGS